ncbi:MAG: SMC-Scp complex subunit ScpB [Acidobacteriaceae bacterium]
MSLKARIEAVIYAAEEPVTLAQLASLFRDEAAAARDARLAAAPAESAEGETPIPGGEVPEPGLAEPILAEIPAQPHAGDLPPTAPAVEPAPDAPLGEPDAGEISLEGEKKAQRQRDREIRDEIRRLVDELIADYNAADRGLEIREVAGGFRMATRAEYHDAVRAFVKTLKPPMKLSLQALETLAVIAYKQPVTAPEIGEIRGVDSGGVLGSLVARKLITTAGRKQVIGRPILYKTTKEFLLRFGLKDLNELPSIEEFEKMASELEEESPTPEEDDSPSAEEFAQNEIAAVEENEIAAVEENESAASVAEGASETPSGGAPTSEHDAASEREATETSS